MRGPLPFEVCRPNAAVRRFQIGQGGTAGRNLTSSSQTLLIHTLRQQAYLQRHSKYTRIIDLGEVSSERERTTRPVMNTR